MESKFAIGDRVESMHNRIDPTGHFGVVVEVEHNPDSGGYMVTVRGDDTINEQFPMWDHEDYFRLTPNALGEGPGAASCARSLSTDGLGALRTLGRYYVHRKCPVGTVALFEIGECDTPRTSPTMWCDRRICEGFWGKEDQAKAVVDLMNGKAPNVKSEGAEPLLAKLPLD